MGVTHKTQITTVYTENSWRTEELSPTTTSRRRVLSIWFSDSGEACRSSSRPRLARPSPSRSNHLTPSRTSRLRSRIRRESPRSAEVDLRRKTAGGRKNSLRLQHPEGEHSSPGSQTQGRHADLRQDLDWQDHHPRGRTIRLHRERQG